MFALSYLVVLFIAAVPLLLTILRERGRPASVAFIHRVYRDLAYIAVAVVTILLLEGVFRIALQNFWFSELGQQYRYWFALGLRVAIFATVFVIGGLFVGFNLRRACRPVAIVPRTAPWFGGFIISAMVAFGATGLWTPLMALLGSAPSGVIDPIFGKDLSFFLLALPLYDEVISLVIWILILTIAAWAGIGFLFYPRPGQPWRYHSRFPELIEERSSGADEKGDVLFLPIRRNAWDGWLPQGMMLGALLCLGLAVARFLDRYHLIIDGHSAVVAGASWVDIHFWLPAYVVVIAGWVAAAIGLTSAACVPRLRHWLLDTPSHWVTPCSRYLRENIVRPRRP